MVSGQERKEWEDQFVPGVSGAGSTALCACCCASVRGRSAACPDFPAALPMDEVVCSLHPHSPCFPSHSLVLTSKIVLLSQPLSSIRFFPQIPFPWLRPSLTQIPTLNSSFFRFPDPPSRPFQFSLSSSPSWPTSSPRGHPPRSTSLRLPGPLLLPGCNPSHHPSGCLTS